jgi:aspartate/tyrosine/aromatic aminotransferase
LFSQPPLDTIRDIGGPELIDKCLKDRELKDLWDSQNTGEQFTAKSLRRLILTALLKKMNNDEYGKVTFQSIIK